MKKMKHFLALGLALTMCAGVSLTAFAEGDADQTTPAAATAVTTNTLEGHTFKAYQIFTGKYSASEDNFSDMKFGSGINSANFIAALISGGYISSTVDASKVTAADVAAVITNANKEDIAKIVEANLATAIDVTEANGVYSLGEQTVDGYYLIVDDSASVKDGDAYNLSQLQVVKTDGKVTINTKKDIVTSDKKVKDINDSIETAYSEWRDSADYDFGDKIDFQLTGTISSKYNDYEYYTYVFHDLESAGLEFDATSVKVYVDDKQITSGYTVVVNPTDNDTFDIVLGEDKTVKDEAGNDVTIKDVKTGALKDVVVPGSKIVVTYKSTLTTAAIVGAVGNDNKMKVEYSNKPNTTSTGHTPEDQVIVFTFVVDVNKVTKNSEGTQVALAGAEFTIEKYDLTSKSWKANQIVKNEAGTTFEMKGVDDGIYRIHESKTPDGYNSIEDIYFEITAEHDEKADTPALKELVAKQIEVTETTADDGKITITYTVVGDEIATAKFTGTVSTGSVVTDVLNLKGAVLPSTGGVGVYPFIIGGCVLVVGAAVLLIVKRKMKEEE